MTWLAVIPGLTAKSVDGVSGFSYPLIFLPFLSSAFVPTAGMPGPVRWFAEHQPVTSIVNTIRALFAGQPVGNDGLGRPRLVRRPAARRVRPRDAHLPPHVRLTGQAEPHGAACSRSASSRRTPA